MHTMDNATALKPAAAFAHAAKHPATAKVTSTVKVPAPAAVKAPLAAKSPAKPIVKKLAVKAPTKVSTKAKVNKAVKLPKEVEVVRAKKPKMVRDSMSMPKGEYAVMNVLKLRAAKLDRPVKKTELLRAGIKALAAMTDTGFLVALKAVPSLKTGRPSQS